LNLTQWWRKFLAIWQPHDVAVSIIAERDADGTALIIEWGTRTQVFEMTNAAAERLARQLAGEVTSQGEAQIAVLRDIVTLATMEIARIEESHAVRTADTDRRE
jgi:hypothetical protein